MPLVERMAVVGVGLIGASLALAAKRSGLVGSVVGVGRGVGNLELARERGIIDDFTHDPAAAAQDADVLLLAVPVGALAAVVRAAAPALRPGTIVTDAGSVKGAVLGAIEAELPAGVAFVGGHPIAGGEQAGAAHADVELFRDRLCILTPGPTSTAAARACVRALWEGVGMRVIEMDADRHDEVLAQVSHVPHVLAYALMNAMDDTEALAFAGPSFRDLTRIAASPTEVWRDIFLANRHALHRTLARVRRAIDDIDRALADADAEALTERIAAARERKRRLDDGDA